MEGVPSTSISKMEAEPPSSSSPGPASPPASVGTSVISPGTPPVKPARPTARQGVSTGFPFPELLDHSVKIKVSLYYLVLVCTRPRLNSRGGTPAAVRLYHSLS